MAFVAFSPLGHGWLVDNIDFKSPDDFAPDDFRRTGKAAQILTCFYQSHLWTINSDDC